MRAAALSLLLGVSLIANSQPPAGMDAASRSQMIADYTKVLNSWDKDGDGSLSKAELNAMNDAILARAHFSSDADAKHFRDDLLAMDAAWDVNKDGFVSLSEMLKGPMADFDCMDTNHDNVLQKGEIAAGMNRCPSLTLDHTGVAISHSN